MKFLQTTSKTISDGKIAVFTATVVGSLVLTYFNRWPSAGEIIFVGFVVSILIAIYEFRNDFNESNGVLTRAREIDFERDLSRLVYSLHHLDKSKSKILKKSMLGSLRQKIAEIETAAMGTMEVTDPTEVTTLPLYLMQNIEQGLDASFVLSCDAIPADRLMAYRERQKESLKTKSVRIRRLYVTENDSPTDEENDAMKSDLGTFANGNQGSLELRYLAASAWEPAIGLPPAPLDFGIWDSSTCWQFHQPNAGTTWRRALVSSSESTLRDLQKTFDANWAKAKPFRK